MTPKCVSLATGRIFETVFDESVTILDDGARLTYGDGGEMDAPIGELFADVIDANELALQRYPFAFPWEQVQSNGGASLEPAGTADARHAITSDDSKDHKRPHWEGLAVAAGLDIDPGDYSTKGKLVKAIKGALQ
jgi:hypothetical protein